MKISDEKINEVMKYYNLLKGKDVHINSYDDEITRREKDMSFGQHMACEKILHILGFIE